MHLLVWLFLTKNASSDVIHCHILMSERSKRPILTPKCIPMLHLVSWYWFVAPFNMQYVGIQPTEAWTFMRNTYEMLQLLNKSQKGATHFRLAFVTVQLILSERFSSSITLPWLFAGSLAKGWPDEKMFLMTFKKSSMCFFRCHMLQQEANNFQGEAKQMKLIKWSISMCISANASCCPKLLYCPVKPSNNTNIPQHQNGDFAYGVQGVKQSNLSSQRDQISSSHQRKDAIVQVMLHIWSFTRQLLRRILS